jgi:branched-chain amino acid transport system substrate-binding protein
MRPFTNSLRSAFAAAAILAMSLPVAAQDAHKVGVLVGLSGLGAQIGKWMLEGAQAGADQVAATGGPKFEIIAEDSQWAPQKAVEGFNKLTNVNNVEFMLSGGSSAMEAIAPLSTQREMIVMNVGAQSSNMAGIGKYVFSILQLSDFDTGVLSRYAVKDLGYKKIATLYVNNDTGTFNQRAFSQAFTVAGGRIVAQESFKPNETVYGAQVAKIRAAQPDAIYIVGTPAEMPFAVRQVKQMAPDLPILSYAGIESKEFLDAAGAAAEGIIYTTTAFDPATDTPIIKDFVRVYEARFGSKPTSPYVGYGYDAIMIAAAAMAKTDGKAGEAMRSEIHKVKTYPGVTGDNVFSEDGTVKKAVAIRKVAGKNFTTVTVVEP